MRERQCPSGDCVGEKLQVEEHCSGSDGNDSFIIEIFDTDNCQSLPLVDRGVTGELVKTPPAPRYGPRSVPRLVMEVSSGVFRTWSQQTHY